MVQEIKRYQQVLAISDFVAREVQYDLAQLVKLNSKDAGEKFEKCVNDNNGFIALVSDETHDERLYSISHIGYSVGDMREEIEFQDYIRLGKPKTIERLVVLSSSG